MDRPPARSDRAADPVLQARERARSRRRQPPASRSRRSTSAPRTTPPSPPSSRPRPPAAPRRRPSSPRRPPSAPPTRTPSPTRTTPTRSPRRASAPAAAPAPAAAGRTPRVVRGHLRPRRGGLRAVARPRRRGQPDLRGALGGPPARRGHDRGGPDRHPPRQWRRRRLSSRACAHTAGRCSSAPPAGPRPSTHGTAYFTPGASDQVGSQPAGRRRRVGAVRRGAARGGRAAPGPRRPAPPQDRGPQGRRRARGGLQGGGLEPGAAWS